MTKKIVDRTRIKGFEPQPLDEDQYFKLFDILHDNCMESNWSATARALGISVLTARKWSRKPPRNPWINHILRQAIQEIYAHMINHVSKDVRKRAQVVSQGLHNAGLHKLKEYMDYNAVNNHGAATHLLKQLYNAPHGLLPVETIKKLRHNGGYSMRILRKASEQLELEKYTEGFGENKVTYWRIPR